MATLTGGPNFAINMAAPIIPGLFLYDDFSFTPTELRFFDAGGDFTSFKGVNFTVNQQLKVTGGTLQRIEVDDDSVGTSGVELLLTGLSTSAKALYDLVSHNKVEEARALLFKGNDFLTGTALKDNLNGYAGADTINGGGNNDTGIGGTGNDVLNGAGGNDTLRGGVGADRLTGGAGIDKLRGNGGIDTMTGGTGADHFIFDSPVVAINADRIVGFSHGIDKIALDNVAFDELTVLGPLNADAFRVAGNPADAQDRVIHNRSNGRLFFDPDGNGADAAILFATVASGLVLTNTDFLVI